MHKIITIKIVVFSNLFQMSIETWIVLWNVLQQGFLFRATYWIHLMDYTSADYSFLMFWGDGEVVRSVELSKIQFFKTCLFKYSRFCITRTSKIHRIIF